MPQTESGLANKSVVSAIKMIQKNLDVKIIRDGKNLLIQKLMEDGFDVTSPSGNLKISSQMMQQALWRTANKMKPLDFEIHGVGRDESYERIMTAAVSTVMDKGRYVNSMRDKDGVFQKLLLYGDGFIHVGTDPDGDQDYPIQFNPISNSNIYVDSYATGVRSGGIGRSANQMCVMFSYSTDTAYEMWPELEKVKANGRIPRDIGMLKELERSYIQTFKLDDLIEVAYFYDLAKRKYMIFAGSQCYVLEDKEGKDYPFVMDGEPYIPVLQYLCMPSSEGFWNYGLGHILYRLALIQQRLMNMAINHAEDNTYPITLVNVPQAEAAKFFNKLQLAHEMRAVGKKGYVAMEYDPSKPGSNSVQAQSLLTNNLMNEWQIVMEQLTRELTRLGIPIDDVERGANVTASQIMSEEESANAWIKQVMEYNASESKFAVELTMDFIKKFVSKNSKESVQLTTAETIENPKSGKALTASQLTQITMGMIASELKEYDYFVIVNSRSGAIPSNIMRQTELQRVMNTTMPGSPAWAKASWETAKLNNVDTKLEDYSMPAPAAPQQGGEAQPTASETSPLLTNVRAAQPIPAI